MKKQSSGWDEIIEDIAGVNLRGLRTIWLSIRNPAELFAACRSGDWQNRKWSPTIRICLFLIAILTLLRFVWVSPESTIGQTTMTSLLQSLVEIDPALATEEALNTVLNMFLAIWSFLIVALAIIAGWLLRIWGAGTRGVTRVRLYFAAIAPGLLFSTVVVLFMEVTKWPALVVIGMFATMAVDYTTTWRGLRPQFENMQLAWRATLLVATNLTVSMLTSALAYFLAVMFLVFKVGVETGQASVLAGG